MSKIDFCEFADQLREYFGSDLYYAALDDLPTGSVAGLHAGLLIAYGIAEDLVLQNMRQQERDFEDLRQIKYKEICDSAHDTWWIKTERVKRI